MAENKQYITQNQENGTVQISEDVLVSIVTVAVNETEGVAGFCTKIGAELTELITKMNRSKGVKITITEDEKLFIECNISVRYGVAVLNVARAVQDNVCAAVESMTGLNVSEVNVNICGISMEQK